ncbi:hypothetical protein V8E55_010267, partial [Tylopilus felleus]
MHGLPIDCGLPLYNRFKAPGRDVTVVNCPRMISDDGHSLAYGPLGKTDPMFPRFDEKLAAYNSALETVDWCKHGITRCHSVDRENLGVTVLLRNTAPEILPHYAEMTDPSNPTFRKLFASRGYLLVTHLCLSIVATAVALSSGPSSYISLRGDTAPKTNLDTSALDIRGVACNMYPSGGLLNLIWRCLWNFLSNQRPNKCQYRVSTSISQTGTQHHRIRSIFANSWPGFPELSRVHKYGLIQG